VRTGLTQLQDSDNLDATGNDASEEQLTGITTRDGAYEYDSTSLQYSETEVNRTIQELYDAIEYGYFGITGNTTRWAQATLLMVYDEMNFDHQEPDIQTSEAQNEVELPY
jgi:hypothetical protein